MVSGWRPRAAAISALVVGLGIALLIQSMIGIAFGAIILVLWFQGIGRINANGKAYIEYAQHLALQKGSKMLGIDESAHAFAFHSQDGVRMALVEPFPQCRFAFPYLSDTFVGLYANNSYDLVNRESKFGGEID